MSREEAIRIIKIVLAVAEDFEITVQGEEFTEEKCKEAVEIVTKALIQEPCEDCISREEAIIPFLVDATEEWTSADVVKYLKSLLSVMPTMRYPQVIGITPIVVPVEEEQGDIQYDNKTTLNKG